ncbi:MAG: hypothetical protein IJW53_05740 [Clostridia bacterium]|nr:hypothetical protein [Clostridia bacterium]
MKKVLFLLFALVISLLTITSCKSFSLENGSTHEHDFILSGTQASTCSRKGTNIYTCSCDETKTEEHEDYAEHILFLGGQIFPSCTEAGEKNYFCRNCSYTAVEAIPAIGHSIGASVEVSRLIPCENNNCSYAVFPESDGKYKNVIVYNFTDEDIARFESIYAELEAIITSAEAYDATLHAYAMDTDLYEQYLAMKSKHDELYDVISYVDTQYEIARVEFYASINDIQGVAVKAERFNYISEIRNELISRFYSFSQPIYDSMYREFYYYGMTEQEIKAFLFDSNGILDTEHKALMDRNIEICNAFNALTSPGNDPKVLELYEEFVSNNNKIANLMGYKNYLDYAYENMYSREYSYSDITEMAGFARIYLSDAYCDFYDFYIEFSQSTSLTNTDVDAYYTQITDSFFTSYESNKLVNDYIDLMDFTSNPKKQITFSDEFNNLVGGGNLFRGGYKGAYVTYLKELEIPIAYFGDGRDTPFTVVHEFGHYMNKIYNADYDNLKQSIDLLDIQSQGNEMLYLSFLRDLLSEKGFVLCENYKLLNMLDTIMSSLAVSTFEQAVYTGTYSGIYSDEIMSDGRISRDEYDLLYTSILEDFGIAEYQIAEYWRYATINAPCYYASYAVSALSAL